MAHFNACQRDNLSSQVIRAVSHAGAEPIRAITAGMLTLETLHAPVAKARELYTGGDFSRTLASADCGGPETVWGFGSSFIKGEPDPMLAGCYNAISELYDSDYCDDPELIYSLPKSVKVWSNKTAGEIVIYPNLAHYTAVLAELIQWPAGMEFLLVAALRAEGWAFHLK